MYAIIGEGWEEAGQSKEIRELDMPSQTFPTLADAVAGV
jgi:hypothetical protein